ncbi:MULTISPECIES: helix-turn-helix domain-containing protein [unclassified Methylobacterium]|uniref:helix-turn-helix domain-containing protein n=1 Tax=unclassified Methylobacterium TaxID=2615210 RepID=UPI001FEE3EB0|nr:MULTISPECIES: helix-turn-helix domain-containing protein [unclassified Methylobacterium]
MTASWDDMSSKEMPQDDVIYEEESTFSDWLKGNMHKQKVSIPELAARTGISYAGIWNIVNGKTQSPRPETRAKLAQALNEVIPAEVEIQIEKEAAAVPGLSWSDFTPSDLQTIPQAGGVYVFYDTTDRPVYVGMSKANVRARVKDHQTRFWFKEPLVVRGAFLEIPDPELCLKIETILIKFLGKHALLNVKGAIRDLED